MVLIKNISVVGGKTRGKTRIRVIQGLLNRWTSQYDWGITAGG